MRTYLVIFFISCMISSTLWAQTPGCNPCSGPWTTETEYVDLNQTYAPNCRVVVEFKFRMCNGVPEYEIISITPGTACNCVTYADLARINDRLREFIIGLFYSANYYGAAPNCNDYLTIDDFFESSCYYPEVVPLDPEVIEWLEEHAQGEAWSTTMTQWKPCNTTSCCQKETSMCVQTNPRTGRQYLVIYETILQPVECDVPAPDGSVCWPTCGYPQPPVPRLTQEDEIEIENELTLSPNPIISYDQLTIEFETQKSGTANVQVYNLQGQLIYGESIITTQGINQYTWSFDDIAAGTYFIHVDNGNRIQTAKLLVLNK